MNAVEQASEALYENTVINSYLNAIFPMWNNPRLLPLFPTNCSMF